MSDIEGRQVARRVAAWHLGDPDWADLIIDAFRNPREAQQELDKEKGE